jgi:hypothetical protein
METIVRRYERAHRLARQTGSLAGLHSLFLPEATMTFTGIDAGPFEGRDAILRAFRDRPPDDDLLILSWVDGEGTIDAVYAWETDPRSIAGRLIFTLRDGRIAALEVVAA